MAAEREDWVNWDNSMKSHIDQQEIHYRERVKTLFQEQQEINKKQREFDDLVRVAIEDSHREHLRTKSLIAICYILFFVDAIMAVIAYNHA